MSRAANTPGDKRFRFTRSNKLDHHVTNKDRSPASNIDATPTPASFVAIQDRLVTPSVQARRNVPVSNSRATSGAPQNNPINAGAKITSAFKPFCRGRS